MRAGGSKLGRPALAALAPALALVVLLAPAGAEAATTCSYNGATDTLTVGGDPDVGTSLTVFNGEIVVSHAFVNGSSVLDCGATDPTPTNTDTIEVEHVAPDSNTLLTITNLESFAPGASDEGGNFCADEIEIAVNLGLGDDTVRLISNDGDASNLELGEDGVDANPTGVSICSDLELIHTLAGVTFDYEVGGDGAADTFSAQGGEATGNPLPGPIVLNGGGGRDVLRGGQADDRIIGGPGGRDKLFGMEGSDGLFAEDGRPDLKINCGEGPKLEEYAVTDRRKDPQPRSC